MGEDISFCKDEVGFYKLSKDNRNQIGTKLTVIRLIHITLVGRAIRMGWMIG